MNTPPPPIYPPLGSSHSSSYRSMPKFEFPPLDAQQIEERLNRTREAFAKVGQMKVLPPQLAQSTSYCFLPTNSSFMNEAIVILPRIENDGNFQLPPPPQVTVPPGPS